MPVIRNVSPYGDLYVPLLRRDVAAGEEVEVTKEQAAQLVPPGTNFQLVEPVKSAPKEN